MFNGGGIDCIGATADYEIAAWASALRNPTPKFGIRSKVSQPHHHRLHSITQCSELYDDLMSPEKIQCRKIKLLIRIQ